MTDSTARRPWPVFLVVFALSTIGLTLLVAPPTSAAATRQGWTTVFADNFDGPAGARLDPTRWLYSLGTGYPGGAPNWGTGEVETMTDSPANVSTDGAGNLAITPLRDAAGRWTSGRVETQRTDLAAPAGGVLRAEASIRQPDVNGAAAAGYWPAFWMLGEAARPVGATNWPSIGEIDVMEGINGRGSHFATLHCGIATGGPCQEPGGIGSGEQSCPDCQTAFHTYAVEHDRSVRPEQLRWYRDGTLFFTVDSTMVDATTWSNALHHGFFIILNVAMGGGFPGAFGAPVPTAETVPGQPMLVDYVAVYTRGGDTQPPSGSQSAYARIQAENNSDQSGTAIEATTDRGGGSNVGWITDGDWLRFDRVDFGDVPAGQIRARVAGGAQPRMRGLVEIRLGSRDNAPIGTFSVGNTGGWQSWRTVSANISGATGVHDVFLTFSSGQPADFGNVNWFTFARRSGR